MRREGERGERGVRGEVESGEVERGEWRGRGEGWGEG